jgi:4-amino-4-deoxy-L-arabinose transferase-like glycosyltransferase
MDTMLAFGLTGSVLSFASYLQNQKNKYLVWYFIFVLFSFFTKSIVGLFLLPAHLLVLLIAKRGLLKNVKLWIGLILSFGLIGLYIMIRGKYEANYFSHLTSYLGRFKEPFNDSHHKPWDFYFNNLFYERFPAFSSV